MTIYLPIKYDSIEITHPCNSTFNYDKNRSLKAKKNYVRLLRVFYKCVQLIQLEITFSLLKISSTYNREIRNKKNIANKLTEMIPEVQFYHFYLMNC